MRNSLTFAGIFTGITLALLPFISSIKLFYGSVNAKYIFITTLISILTVYFSYLLIKRKHVLRFRNRWLLLLLVSVLLLQYFSTFLGAYPEGSLWSDILRSTGVFFLSYLAIFSFITSELFSAKDWSFNRRSIAVSGAFFAFLTYFTVGVLNINGKFLNIDFSQNSLTLGNSTFAGAFLLIAVILTLVEIARPQPKSAFRRIFVIFLFIQVLSPLLFNAKIWLGKISITEILSNPALVLGEARSSSATVFAVLAFFFGWLFLKKVFRSREEIKKYITPIWASIWVIAVLGSIVLLFTPDSFVQKAYIEQSTAARPIVWQSGLEAFKERPILGWGPENFRFAWERNFDNRVYLQENIGEVWFDKAHNFFIDTLVTTGVLGILTVIALWIYFLLIVIKSGKKKLIGSSETTLLGVLIFGHILQLQTGFDTVATYTVMALVIGYGLWLEKDLKDIKDTNNLKDRVSPIFGVILIIITVFSFWHLVIKEYRQQSALVEVFRTEESEKQLELINTSLENTPHFEMLRLAFNSLVKGGLGAIVSNSQNSEKVQEITSNMVKHLNTIEVHFKDYLEKTPNDYRARMNYSYLLLVKTGLGDNRLEEAKDMVESSYELSPNNPLTYIIDGLVELYSGNILSAKEKINQAIALNPDIEFSKNIMSYVEAQEEKFPNISIIRLGNL